MVIYRVRDVLICVLSGKKKLKCLERKIFWFVFMLFFYFLFDCRVFYWFLNVERFNKK